MGSEQATRERERVIRLTPQEIANAKRWARQRNDGAVEGRGRDWGNQGLAAHVPGQIAELAVDRYLGLPPRTRHISYAEEMTQHFDTPPPGAVQVKATSKAGHGLTFIPEKGNCPWCPYILAFIPDLDDGIVHLRGWAIGEQVQAEGYFVQSTGYPFYALSPHRLFALPEQPHSYFYLDQTICRKMSPSRR